MKGLLVKEFLGCRSFLRIYIFIIAICIIPLAITGDGEFSGGFAIGICTFIGAMLCFTSFAYDAANHWDQFVLTLPYTRKQIVGSKYVFSLLMIGIGMGAGLALNLVFAAAGLAVIDMEVATVTAALVFLACLFLSIVIPLIYKLGVEKSRIVVVVIFLIPCMIFIAFSSTVENGMEGAVIGLKNASQGVVPLLTWLLPLIGVAALAVSYFISVRVFGRKEM